MQRIDLNGRWNMRRVGEAEWIPAQVPGSVYADLMRAGKMEDPFYRENEAKATAVTENDYEYGRTFEVTAEQFAHDCLLLRCEGLDTLCDLYLNGAPVLRAENMHRTYEADVGRLLKAGENTLRAVFHSPNRFIARENEKLRLDESNDTMHGFSHLRKAHYMFGWDWGPKLPDMGIWRGISIECRDVARLSDVYVTQEHADGMVRLHVRVEARMLAQAEQSGLSAAVSVTAPDGTVTGAVTSLSDRGAVLNVELRDPQLWWPNGMGGQPLYGVAVTLICGECTLDEKRLRVGLRTLTVKTEPDRWGTSFAFTVNGVPFFAMGGNYIPEDNLLGRVTPERTETLLKSCADAHYNMVRVWGGGIYPDDFFYDLCDRYGLVVWQDLAYACAAYRFTNEFRDNIIAETADNVRRIRHHACLGLWCGNNEMESAWVYWGWSERFDPHLKADYTRQFDYVLPELMQELDSQTFYWRSSPSSGGDFDDPDDENRGDRHYWAVWHGLEPFTAYRDHFPRFLSEFGIQSFPCLKTVERFTLPEDRNIFSPVMESHQKNSAANGKILYYVSENYRYPKNFDSLLYVSQLIQAEGMRYAVEHLRRNRERCMGALVWQVNDCWPVASWSSIDYYGRWKALQYAERRFFAPVMISACEDGARVELYLHNDTRADFSGAVSWKLLDGDSNTVLEGGSQVRVPALSAAPYTSLDFSEQLDSVEKRRSLYLRFTLSEAGKTIGRGTVLFVKPKHYDLKEPGLSVRAEDGDGCIRVFVSARAFAKDVELIPREDAVLSDNFFDLAGGEERCVEAPAVPGGAAAFLEGLRVRSLRDTYGTE